MAEDEEEKVLNGRAGKAGGCQLSDSVLHLYIYYFPI